MNLKGYRCYGYRTGRHEEYTVYGRSPARPIRDVVVVVMVVVVVDEEEEMDEE